MKIYVVFTGGTIGSEKDDNNIINAKKEVSDTFLAEYRNRYSDNTEFAVSFPYMILSENINADNFLALISEVNRILDNGDAAGIIINHGTDTLQYSAAILSYVFAACNIPIVFVSSNYVISDSRANGIINFRYAVRFIKERHGKGVFVSYKNTGDNPVIHRGTRLLRHAELSDDLMSIKDTWYGKYIDDSYVSGDLFITKSVSETLFDDTKSIRLYQPKKELIRIIPYPGMSYPILTSDTKAVLHESYHSGTIAVNDEFISFAESALEKNIPVYLTGLSDTEAVYASAEKYLEYKITALPECSSISQYCKLWLSICNNLDILSVMQKSYADEFVNL